MFSSDVDASIWSEVTLGSAWSQLWQDDPQQAAAQPWAYDSDVRLGIKHALILDRIDEERARLATEQSQVEAWLEDTVLTAWHAAKEAREAGKRITCGTFLVLMMS